MTTKKHYTLLVRAVMFFALLSTSLLFSQKTISDSLNQNNELKSSEKENISNVAKSNNSNPILYVTKGTFIFDSENISNIHIVEVQKKSQKQERIAKVVVDKKQKKKEYIKIAAKKATTPNEFTYKAFPNHSHFTSESEVKNIAIISNNSSISKNASCIAVTYISLNVFCVVSENNFEEKSFICQNIISQNNFARPPPVKIS